MSLPIFDRPLLCAAAVLSLSAVLSGCDGAPDNQRLAEAEAAAARRAAEDGRINCALGGAALFDRTCTVEQMTGSGGSMLVVGRADAGFRRLLITGDGRGLVSADGAEEAIVRIVDQGMIEVEVSGDRYRLPATIKGGEAS